MKSIQWDYGYRESTFYARNISYSRNARTRRVGTLSSLDDNESASQVIAIFGFIIVHTTGTTVKHGRLLLFSWVFPSCRVAGVTDDLLAPLARVFPSRVRLFNLPFPSTFVLATFVSACSSSFSITHPCQFNLLSVTVLEVCATPAVYRLSSFLILFSHVAPPIHRSILVLFTSIRSVCLFVLSHVSVPL